MLRFMSFPWLKRLLAPSPRDATGIGMIMGVSYHSSIMGSLSGADQI
jgi:hypothetical protein